MFENDAELASIIESRGGAFKNSENPLLEEGGWFFGECASHISDCLTFATEKICPGHRIDFRWINDTSLNAFAFTASDHSQSFIGVNIGVAYTLHDFFNRLMCDSSFLPLIGNSTLETTTRGNIPFLTTDVVKDYPHFRPVRPRCDIRMHYASYAFSICLDFLIFHEVTHIANGHCRLIREFLDRGQISEMVAAAPSERHMLLQALEMDADCVAVGWVFDRMVLPSYISRKLMGAPTTNPILLAARNALCDLPAMVQIVTLATYSFFRLFNRRDWDVFDLHKLTHPDPPMRQFIVCSNITTRLILARDEGFDLPDEEIFRMQSIMFDVEESIARLLDDSVDAGGLASVVLNSLHGEYLQKLGSAWLEVRPRLNQLKLHERDLST